MSDDRLYKRIYQLLLQLHTEPTARMLAEKWTREMKSEAQWDHFLDGMTEEQRAGYFHIMAMPEAPKLPVWKVIANVIRGKLSRYRKDN